MSGSTRFEATPLSSDHQTRFVEQNMRAVCSRLIYRMVWKRRRCAGSDAGSLSIKLQRRDQLKDLDKAAHWLSRIASNTAIDFALRSGRVDFSDIDEMLEPATTAHENNPEQLVLRGEHHAYLEAGLNSLTGRERTALLLRDVEGLPADEVASQLNCSKATVRSHIANARVKLQ